MGVIKHPDHLDMDGNRIANLGDPTSPTEAANKGYVDQAVAKAVSKAIAAYEASKSVKAPAPVTPEVRAAGSPAAIAPKKV